MNVVLVEPEIAPNVGNIARLCAATRTVLHLVEPFGFQLDDSRLRRAGMDYWRHVTWHRWRTWGEFRESQGNQARMWFVESNGPKHYAGVSYSPDDYLVFGRESAGLPKPLIEENRARWVRIPMFNDSARSLNLSNCAALVLFEALRQQGFRDEIACQEGRGG